MTVNKLIKQLQVLQAKGLGRLPVVVDKTSLWDGNDTFQICSVHSVRHDLINQVDGDGFMIENKRGGERMRNVIVLRGGQ